MTDTNEEDDVAMSPAHPTAGSGDPTPRTRTARPTRWQQLIGVLGIAVVFWAGSNIYDVVTSSGPQGGGGHRPPGTSPHGGGTSDQPSPDGGGAPGDQPAPPAGGQHDPSQFDHG